MKAVPTTTCYLCGKLLAWPTNGDHPIMQQLFAPELRRKYNVSQLVTLEVHESCNTAYKKDEDYFVQTLTPFARGSEAGNAIFNKVIEAYHRGKEVSLTRKVLREFDPRPGGLFLPSGKVMKRFEGERLRRVAWKMVRGLHFYHSGEVLPERWSTVGVKLFGPHETPTDDVIAFASTAKPHGRYPGVFDYKFDKFTETTHPFHYWLLLLWDRIIFRVTFHDPACGCETCEGDRASLRATPEPCEPPST